MKRLLDLSGRVRVAFALLATGALLAALAGPSSALADAPATPWLSLSSSTNPAYLVPGGEGDSVSATAANLGDAELLASPAHPVTLTDVLPEGWTAVKASAIRWPKREIAVAPVCTVSEGRVVRCLATEPLAPYERWEIATQVSIPSGVAPGKYVNEVKAEGGEGAGTPLSTTPVDTQLTASHEPTPFGIEAFEVNPESDEGKPESQAGSHPFQLTTRLNLNSVTMEYVEAPGGGTRKGPSTPSSLRDLHVNLPPGLIGNTRAVPQCSDVLFATKLSNDATDECPANTAIGAAIVFVDEFLLTGPINVAVPVFNLVPAKGEPARFGFMAEGVPVVFDTVVNGGDYHVVVTVLHTPNAYPVLSSLVSIWGNPGDPRHDQSRGTSCVAKGYDLEGITDVVHGCKPTVERATEPFLTLPTSCEGPLLSSAEALSWDRGASFLEPILAASPETLTGCDKLPFTPELSVKPTERSSNTPTGMKVLLKVPQTSTLEEKGLGEADLRGTTVTLPQGVQLSPSAANGLQACSESAVGYEKQNPTSHTLEFKPEEANEESKTEEEARETAGTLCPKASKVGTVRIKTPVLTQELRGSVYLAAQENNPFGSLFAIYVVVKDPQTGVVVKLAGEVKPDPVTGQVTTTFANAPQDPFEEFELELFSGPRASVATPRACGNYATQASFTPWSGTGAVGSFGAPSGLEFGVESGPHGTPCASPQPFTPGLVAGTTSGQAGALTGFTLTLTRSDTDQAPKEITMTLPPGLAGYLKNVVQCPEQQANEGTCGPGSLIGHAEAVAGLGSDPFTETGGRVYITGPYHDPETGHTSPFGLSIVIPAVAGPFDFGNVVTRSAIDVDPSTAQLKITSKLPTMLNTTTHQTGAPVQLRRVDVTVERPGNAPFQFNPTNCSPLSISGTIKGDQGGEQAINQPFQVSGCDKLPFSPELTAETSSKWTKVMGTSLKVIVRDTPGQANIAKTKIVFPEQLPSRLTTIQKACPEAVFAANPATCPEGSVIGSAIAHTPVLNSALSGPAYLVSHGGAAFPDAEFVLQGEGITLVLDGQTNIHNGITSSTFNAVPDAPVTTFEVTLPAGPHSAFTGYGDLCNATKTVTKRVTVTTRVHKKLVHVKKTVKQTVSEKLTVPTTLTGQNGDRIEQTTPLVVSQCQAVKSFKKAKKPSKSKKKSKKHKKK
jgi:hypothetical protein